MKAFVQGSGWAPTISFASTPTHGQSHSIANVAMQECKKAWGAGWGWVDHTETESKEFFFSPYNQAG